MCFGRKDNIQEEDAPRPAQFAPPQPTYASTPAKASVPTPVSPLSPSPASPAYPPSQPPPPPIAELASPSRTLPAELGNDDVAPPPGPPPGRSAPVDDIAPPPGPPPSHRPAGDNYSPPPGPPPSSKAQTDDYTAPPPGPPPSQSAPQQHDWQSLVPDTALFPPPPDLFAGYDRSPATNATEAEAEAGEAWCGAHPLSAPLDRLDAAAAAALAGRAAGHVRLLAPDELGCAFGGRLECVGRGVWRGRTDRKAGDYCYIAYPPLYAVGRDSPLLLGGAGRTRTTTAYYEVRVLPENARKDGISLAVGFAALPYPSFRMPGWHRGSLAVHGDDGHRYVNDRWGGKDFTRPMRRGETYGLGMVFAAGAGGRIETEVFFTRQGAEVGRWNLHEETDAEQDLPVTGLEGYHDLAAAVGTYGEVAFEVVFDPAKWAFRGLDAL